MSGPFTYNWDEDTLCAAHHSCTALMYGHTVSLSVRGRRVGTLAARPSIIAWLMGLRAVTQPDAHLDLVLNGEVQNMVRGAGSPVLHARLAQAMAVRSRWDEDTFHALATRNLERLILEAFQPRSYTAAIEPRDAASMEVLGDAMLVHYAVTQ